MAKLIQAIGAYGPRVEVARTVQTRQMCDVHKDIQQELRKIFRFK